MQIGTFSLLSRELVCKPMGTTPGRNLVVVVGGPRAGGKAEGWALAEAPESAFQAGRACPFSSQLKVNRNYFRGDLSELGDASSRSSTQDT